MLELNGADWEPVWVDFFNGGTRTPEHLGLNQMGEVPVLEHGELTLSQSGVILDYLSERYRDFGPRSDEERREILRWTLWDNHKLTGSIAPLRYLMKFVPEEKSDQHVIAWLGKRAGNALKVLDRRLFTQEWLAADHITTADLSCVGYLYYDPFYSGYGGFGYDDLYGFGGGGGGGGYAVSDQSRFEENGSLRLKINPKQAQIFIDGAYVGVVDNFDGAFQKLSLQGGGHKVELKADGYQPLQFEVLISPNETSTYKGEMKRVQ